ncbi:hypothetical protein WJ0W_000895 [Paenibacillus melissococcoides]|uniref:Uncharacterized protein n=1 Tax=Paenibacillus melissococcoides TaxID=2912268 RepID=A0ABN8TY22_9BACL|nr:MULTISPECIES: hypothetical protein [Paenibacillus]GIO77459.1 hypothetical protein J6TS7_10690 [Paenibacillus dendritiformis]CAH8243655.1 hypothetical protein WJ0W_000895 [Paenibacillus melissococcoides]CAH8704984.1 hypothetical protein HTL2_000755 [Paenibacillus melissococcoides]CAH8707757.1 hypothetical protein WDD9_001718 [Paenibacillus melissococcoides]
MIGESSRLKKLSINDQINIRNHVIGMFEGFLLGANELTDFNKEIIEEIKKEIRKYHQNERTKFN